jgi:hypothetical protein
VFDKIWLFDDRLRVVCLEAPILREVKEAELLYFDLLGTFGNGKDFLLSSLFAGDIIFDKIPFIFFTAFP